MAKREVDDRWRGLMAKRLMTEGEVDGRGEVDDRRREWWQKENIKLMTEGEVDGERRD